MVSERLKIALGVDRFQDVAWESAEALALDAPIQDAGPRIESPPMDLDSATIRRHDLLHLAHGRQRRRAGGRIGKDLPGKDEVLRVERCPVVPGNARLET